jgi:hypothetical protein
MQNLSQRNTQTMKIPVDKVREFISGPPICDDLEEAVAFAHHDAAGLALLIAARHTIELAQEFSDEGSDELFVQILGHMDAIQQRYKS